MIHTIPQEALAQHVAILGKTGSGKTSTAKLAIEQVVKQGARVCILDPIKSDWWGLTSSADGKHPGLPFHILGGPRGHVPLHASAGKAIGEIVANGSLPLSILDMADFEPGGQARFFVDFAPVLMRKMRGVVYLVIEEAHLFAPKERSGVGAENLSIHWAKTLATASRTKGLRLIVLTQRTQALHNAVLGSCDTVIVHRMTQPADQDPVTKWLKANVKEKEIRAQVEDSIPNLKTGTGWICSSEAKIFELVEFPRIHTYDNTATPTGDGEEHAVKTAPVDQERLRAIVGTAVAEAEANDPKMLQKRIRDLEAQLAADGMPVAAPVVDKTAIDEARAEGFQRGYTIAKREGWGAARTELADWLSRLRGNVDELIETMQKDLRFERDSGTGFEAPAAPIVTVHPRPEQLAPATRQALGAMAQKVAVRVSDDSSGKRRVMIALAQNPAGLHARKLSILAGVKRSGSTWRGIMAGLRRALHVVDDGEFFRLTPAGLQALGKYEPLPTGRALLDYWRSRMGDGTRRAIFDAIADAYPRAIAADKVGAIAGIDVGGSTWRGHLAKLRGLELVTGSGELKASEDLF